MKRCIVAFLLSVLAVAAAVGLVPPAASLAGYSSLSEIFLSRVIPLPKEATIADVLTLPLSQIGITVVGGTDPQLATIREVMAPLEEAEGRPFSIRFVLSREAGKLCPKEILERLESLPNADQAYAIFPTYGSTGSFSGLVVVAPNELGLLYGARTLSQMMGFRGRKRAAVRDEVNIPEVTLVDWPDMSERGIWGSVEKEDLPWLAECKLNALDHKARVSYDDVKGRGVATVDPEMLAVAARVGIKIVPIITHLELAYERSGLAEKRPDLAATPGPDAPSTGRQRATFCFSKPGTAQVLADWLEDLAQVPGATDTIVWLSEEESPCFCDQCSGKESYLLEVAALVEAFKRAKAADPDTSLRILLTQGSYHANDKILAAAHEDVKIVYYDGGRTYDSSHRPMIYPLLEAYAGAGGWLGVYPQVTNSWRTVTCWTAPQFIRYRMNEFVNKRLKNVTMYAVPKPKWHEFNVTAAAEWLWNSKGRTDEEFSFAWAQSKGMEKPRLFAQWATAVGPIGWDLAGSGLGLKLIYYLDIGAPRQGFQSIRYGEMFLEEIHSREHLDRLVRQADDALALAVELENEAAVSETRIHKAFLILAGALQVLSGAPESPDGLTPGQLERYRVAFEELDYAARTLEVEHFRWADLMEPGERPGRLMDTVAIGYRCAALAADAIQQLGLDDPMPEYHPREVGSWTPDDFVEGNEYVLSLDMSKAWLGPGPYVLYFEHDPRQGSQGVRIGDVILSSLDREGIETELKRIPSNLSLHSMHRWDEQRFDFPEIASTSLPRVYVNIRVSEDKPASHGKVSIRRGLKLKGS